MISYYRQGRNLVLLKFIFIIANRSWLSVSLSPRWRPRLSGRPLPLVGRRKTLRTRLKRVGILDQHPRDILKPAGLENDLNIMCSIERKQFAHIIPNLRKLIARWLGWLTRSDVIEPLFVYVVEAKYTKTSSLFKQRLMTRVCIQISRR